MKKSLTRRERLFTKSDITLLFKFAKRVECTGLQLLYCENNCDYKRMTVFLKRGFKNSVQRNRQKRLIKETYRNIKNSITKNVDLLFIVFPYYSSSKKIFSQIHFLLKKAGLLIENENLSG